MPDRYRLSRRTSDSGTHHDYALVVELPSGDVIGQAWAPGSIDQMDELVRLANIAAAAELRAAVAASIAERAHARSIADIDHADEDD